MDHVRSFLLITLVPLIAALAPSATLAQENPAEPRVSAPPAAQDPQLAPQQPAPQSTPVELIPASPQAAPLAGYTNGTFFLRSPNNNFFFYPDGRLNVDGYFFPVRPNAPMGVNPDGPADTRPRDTFSIRRARAEFGGTFLRHFDYYLGGEFATTPAGQQYGTFTDVFLLINYTPWANIQMGQFDAPFMLENRTSDKYIDFMERSIAVRDIGEPNNKELGLMVWGLAPRKFVYYSLGMFNGAGQSVKNVDSDFTFMGRAYFAPLALMKGAQNTRWMTDIWVGGSMLYGTHTLSGYVLPAITSQGGVTLLPTSFGIYKLGLNQNQLKYAFEVNAPVGPFGLRFELVRIDHEGVMLYNASAITAAAPIGSPLSQLTRSATAFYVQAWYWILGDYHLLPSPGQEVPKRFSGYKPETGPWKLGLYATAKYERMTLSLDQADQVGLPIAAKATLGGATLDVAEVALSLWLTKHVRFEMNYVLDYLDGDMPLAGKSPFYRTPEHEILLRAEFAM